VESLFSFSYKQVGCFSERRFGNLFDLKLYADLMSNIAMIENDFAKLARPNSLITPSRQTDHILSPTRARSKKALKYRNSIMAGYKMISKALGMVLVSALVFTLATSSVIGSIKVSAANSTKAAANSTKAAGNATTGAAAANSTKAAGNATAGAAAANSTKAAAANSTKAAGNATAGAAAKNSTKAASSVAASLSKAKASGNATTGAAANSTKAAGNVPPGNPITQLGQAISNGLKGLTNLITGNKK
jgi:hypothetical protein